MGKLSKKSIESELEDIVGSQAKSFMAAYSSLHHALLAVVKTTGSVVMSDCFNKVVAVVLHEVGLLSVTQEELLPFKDRDTCLSLIDEKARIAKTVVSLFYVKLLEDKTVEEFVEQIDEVAATLKQRIITETEGSIN